MVSALRKWLSRVLAAVAVDHGLLEAALHFLGLALHHGGLVGDADGDEVLVGIEAGRVGALELLEELLLVAALADVVADVIGLLQGEDDEVMRAAAFADGLRDGGLGFLVPGLAVDDGGGALVAVLAHALPDAHDVAAGGVDLVAADFLEAVEHLHLRAEGGDDDDVLLGQAVEVVDAARFLELLDAHVAELVVDLGVVDDFAEEIDVVAGEDLGGGVGEVDGALDAVTKAEGLRQLDREAVGGEVAIWCGADTRRPGCGNGSSTWAWTSFMTSGVRRLMRFWPAAVTGIGSIGHLINRQRRERVKGGVG